MLELDWDAFNLTIWRHSTSGPFRRILGRLSTTQRNEAFGILHGSKKKKIAALRQEGGVFQREINSVNLGQSPRLLIFHRKGLILKPSQGWQIDRKLQYFRNGWHTVHIGHSGFSPRFLFRWKTLNFQGMGLKTDVFQEPSDILASKMTFYVVSITLFDQFWCQNISRLLENISFAIHALNVQCFSATQK